ncbi:hypothetical protein P4H65_14900 [Paenibacillus chitinolyticus]|uniref:hypothetical protein n=1 Tax=Paenibacillus chitinolyticus TaxID=79263 RepID=UPI002DB68F20|nr:hypothetical protein [Paenibacillus chitinolyticus]MEC0247081.1 hypothetical protein [Paenibacillus chitinolyticus]
MSDPSSGLVVAWNYFDDDSRKIFLKLMNFDENTVNRARGWALWKALITYAWNEKGSEASNWGKHVMDTIVRDYKRL